MKSPGPNPANAGVKETVRLRPRLIKLKNGTEITTDTVRVRFETTAQKIDLYKALVAKGKENPKIKVADAIPYDLLGRKKFLDTLAGDYRTAKPGTKTRTVCRFGEMIILVKSQDDAKFKKRTWEK